MENGNAKGTTDGKSGLTEIPSPNVEVHVVPEASVTSLLCEAQTRLDAEMESTPCNQTEAARHAVKTALECLDARNKDRVSAAKG